MNRPTATPNHQSSARKTACRNVLVTFGSALISALVLLASGCASNAVQTDPVAAPINSRNPDDFFVVDCLLPGKIQQLGQSFPYLTPRRPIKTTAFDCGLRGGEFTAYNRASYETALKVWLPQAEQGDVEAQSYVGEIYDKGLGVAPDYAKAAVWYQKAADQGSSRARINLGYLYEKGLGVDQDVATALNLYRDASGLTGDDLTFESTIEVETRESTGAARKQIEALERDFETSRMETEALRKQLSDYEKVRSKERNRLDDALQQLEKERRKTQSLEKQKPSGDRQSNRNLDEQRQQLEKARAGVLAERAKIRSMEQKFEQDTGALTNRLDKAEAKANTYKKQLEQNSSARAQIPSSGLESRKAADEMKRREEEIRALKAKLASNERQLRAELNGTLDELEAANKKLAAVQNQPASPTLNREVQQFQQELEKKQAEVLQQSERLTEAENSHKKELQRITAKLDEAIQQSQSYKDSLNQNVLERGKLDEKLVQTESELRQIKEQLQTVQSEKSQQATSDSSEQVKKLQRDLAVKEAVTTQLLQAKNKEVVALKAKIQQIEQTATVPVVKAADLNTPPKIVMLDPPLTAIKTRGRNELAVKLRSAEPSREIVGRAEARSGILSFKINDQAPENLDSSGLFKTTVQVANRQTPVNITLIDNNGSRATLDFVMIPGTEPSGGDQQPKDKPIPGNLSSNIEFGSYHALLIGNEKYTNMPTLDTPIDDVREIDTILRKKYKFQTTVLTNANRYDILSALNKLRAELTEQTNLLIYYAGHGEIDKVNQRGQWLPVDADLDNNANWISTSAITEIINMMSVKHILVVADSCYSGAMTRASLARLDPGMSSQKKLEWLKTITLAKSRTVLTSGGVKPVLDSGADGHSIFAKALINVLNQNTDILEGQILYQQISGEVRKDAKRLGFDQSPQYGPIRHTGHEAGEFFFVPAV